MHGGPPAMVLIIIHPPRQAIIRCVQDHDHLYNVYTISVPSTQAAMVSTGRRHYPTPSRHTLASYHRQHGAMQASSITKELTMPPMVDPTDPRLSTAHCENTTTPHATITVQQMTNISSGTVT